MKYNYIIGILFLALSCNTKEKDKSIRDIVLERQNVSIELKVPKKFYVYQKAYKISDCGCPCESIRYRFSNSQHDNSLKRDTIPNLDIIDQSKIYKRYSFVISHNACTANFSPKDFDPNSPIIKRELESYVYRLKTDQPSLDFTLDEKKNINNHFFRIIAFQEISDSSISEYFKAYTMASNGIIEFNGYRIAPNNKKKNSSKFINEVHKILESVKIKKTATNNTYK